MIGNTRREVISLYKSLLRYKSGLQYTDKDYFYRRIRYEFEKNKYLASESDIQFQIGKAKSFLKKAQLT